MVTPALLTGIEKRDYGIAKTPIDGANIASLVTVARITAKAKVFDKGFPAMFLGNDMVNRKINSAVGFCNPAIFAASLSAIPHLTPKCHRNVRFTHLCCALSLRRALAFTNVSR